MRFNSETSTVTPQFFCLSDMSWSSSNCSKSLKKIWTWKELGANVLKSWLSWEFSSTLIDYHQATRIFCMFQRFVSSVHAWPKHMFYCSGSSCPSWSGFSFALELSISSEDYRPSTVYAIVITSYTLYSVPFYCPTLHGSLITSSTF